MSPTARSRRARTAILAGAVLAALATAGCGDGETPGASPTPSASTASPSPSPSTSTPSESASPSPSESASPEDLEGFSTKEQRSPSWPELGDRIGTGTAVRVGSHTGYDRVVYEFSGTGRPTYDVKYVDEPKDSNSGDPVDVPGDAYLSVSITSVQIPDENATPPADPSDASLKGTVVTYAPAIWGGFEGYGEQFIGISGQERPFRVSVLKNPTRFVVDIAK